MRRVCWRTCPVGDLRCVEFHNRALRGQRVQRARHEADLARRRFMEADPTNRLVVDVLEAEWNEKLRTLHEVQAELEQRRSQAHRALSEVQRKQILALATDFPRLWNDPRTPQRERKRMARLLLDDVTLTKGDEVVVGVRLRGGTSRRLTLPLAQPAWQLRQTPAQIVAEIDALLAHHTEGEIAALLNERGYVSGEGGAFHAIRVQRICRAYGIRRRYARLRDAGLLTATEIAGLLGVSIGTVKKWRDCGLLRAQTYNEKHQCLYDPPGNDPPVKCQGQRLSKRRRFPEVAPNPTKEVQCEA